MRNLKATKKQADEMWDMIEASGRYTYNKAQRTAYSMISNFCMYLKKYHPVGYMAGCFNHSSNDDKLSQFFSECKRLVVKVNPVDHNKFKAGFSVTDNGELYCGFGMLKGVGEVAADAIVENQPYEDVGDFEKKVDKRKANKRVREQMKRAGVFGESENFTDYVEAYNGFIFGDLPDWRISGLSRCRKCNLCQGRTQVVLGSGNDEAEIMIVGEAPGYSEDKRGRPFVGRGGEILRKDWLPKINLHPARDCYITNIVKCIPRQGDRAVRKPTEVEKRICGVWLEKEMQIVKPKILIAVGGSALGAVSEQKSILRTHGKFFDVVTPHNRHPEIKGFALVHPAYILRGNKVDMDKALSN